jgi:acyl-CoA thioester hydrolase
VSKAGDASFTKEVVVRFGECDGLGHVNNGTYFTYMEEARMDIFRLFNPTLELSKWNLIVASTRCDFLQQVTYAETLKIFTWISRIGLWSITLSKTHPESGSPADKPS